MKCRLCKGDGRIRLNHRFPYTCPGCDGTKESVPCGACKGKGAVKTPGKAHLTVCGECRGNMYVPGKRRKA